MTLERTCDACGVKYRAKHGNSRYCTAACRQRASVARNNGRPVLVATPRRNAPTALPTETVARPGGIVEQTRAQLERVERLDTVAGAHAMLLAERLESAQDSTTAALSKAFAEAMDRAMEGVAVADDPLDMLAERRRARRGA